jgi:hypothetical protein
MYTFSLWAIQKFINNKAIRSGQSKLASTHAALFKDHEHKLLLSLQSNNIEHLQIYRTTYVEDKYAIYLGYATTHRNMTNLGMKQCLVILRSVHQCHNFFFFNN